MFLKCHKSKYCVVLIGSTVLEIVMVFLSFQNDGKKVLMCQCVMPKLGFIRKHEHTTVSL